MQKLTSGAAMTRGGRGHAVAGNCVNAQWISAQLHEEAADPLEASNLGAVR